MDEYDPFVRGEFPVGVHTIQAFDQARDRLFPCEIWYPAAAQQGTYPLIVFSHSSVAGRAVVAPEPVRRDGETAVQKNARTDAWIANRVPDIRFLRAVVALAPAGSSHAKPGILRVQLAFRWGQNFSPPR